MQKYWETFVERETLEEEKSRVIYLYIWEVYLVIYSNWLTRLDVLEGYLSM